MKNIFLSILAVTAVLFLLTSCGCEHEWKNATCTKPQTCTKCGKTEGDPLGHRYGKAKIQKEPNCTEPGIKETMCTRCGEKTTTEISATGHKWVLVNEEKAATCSDEGSEKYKCSVCGEIKHEKTKKLSHQYKDGYCVVCSVEDPSLQLNPTDEEKKKTNKIKTIGDREVKKEDDFYYLLFSFSDEEQNTIVAPCLLEMRIVNDKDETVYKARRIIGTSDYSSWSNAYRKWILASPRIMRSDIKEGLSSEGAIYFTVKLYDGSYFEESSLEISGLPVHSFDKEEIIKEATCGTDGLARRTCSSCGEVVEETIPATGRHTYRKGVVQKEPTCVSDGIIGYSCVVCGVIGRTEKIEKIEHSFVNDKCTYCGTLRKGSRGAAGGIVFYDCDLDNEEGNADGLISSECGWRFLEAAPQDIGEAIFGYYRNSPNGKNLFANGDVNYYEENCTGTGIGCGKKNTEMLVDAMGDEAYTEYSGSEKTGNYAAKMCADYSFNGYDDWSLPSKDELNLIYRLGSITSNYYWSSSEYNSLNAWGQYVYSGGQYYNDRDNYRSVRPIRAFSEDELCNHSWGTGVVTIPATCINDGVIIYTCEICKQTKEECIPATGVHTYVYYKCTGCGIWGKGPAGGYVFYDCDADNDSGNADGLISSECGWRYLEAAPADLDSEYMYGGYLTEIGNTSTAIGKGRVNTENIINKFGAGEYAAKVCWEYECNDYDDWFLPSKDELNLMYMNLHEKGVGNFQSKSYWSSSVYSSYDAWSQDFYFGGQYYDYRYFNYYVRPVRAFM